MEIVDQVRLGTPLEASSRARSIHSVGLGSRFNDYGGSVGGPLFAQDDWKVTPRLTANIGMTWDFTFAGHQQDGHWTNFDLTAEDARTSINPDGRAKSRADGRAA